MKKQLILLAFAIFSLSQVHAQVKARETNIDAFAAPLPQTGHYFDPHRISTTHSFEFSRNGRFTQYALGFSRDGKNEYLTTLGQFMRAPTCSPDLTKFCPAQRESWRTTGIVWRTAAPDGTRLALRRESAGTCAGCTPRPAAVSVEMQSELFWRVDHALFFRDSELELIQRVDFDRNSMLDAIAGKIVKVRREGKRGNELLSAKRGLRYESDRSALVNAQIGLGSYVIELRGSGECELLEIPTGPPARFFRGRLTPDGKCEVIDRGEAFVGENIIVWMKEGGAIRIDF